MAREVQVADSGAGVDVVFYGDSITETWRGTDMGRGCRRCAGVPAVFQKYFGKYSTAVLAVGGDQASHLLWRLQHGDTFVRHSPAAAVVMIGTNDLGAAACLGGQPAITRAANGTAMRVEAVLGHLRRANPRTQLLVLGILPRGWTDAAHVYAWPSMYAPGVATLNAALAAWAARDTAAAFLDCGAALLPSGRIEPGLMPDALHPNAEGMELFAKCIAPALDERFAASTGDARGGLWKLGG
ncbi:hypothetical protein WJX81_005902 [Elliptochloris bilobata]|uniref:SGNH hydrolase-type esterase domain-containing protein n=1 Tax=Elliptochloris bilobata TaxID=381761 RepID=A0AAW1RPH5_9CHLO